MVTPVEDGYEALRKRMVEEQLVRRGISVRRVLDAFLEVPRELFVPEGLRDDAYFDGPLPTKAGQTISQPYMVAYMTELLELPAGRECKLLEVGLGSGYQAAILAWLGHKVVGVERLEPLARFAEENLAQLPYGDKVEAVVGDGTLGWPEEAPFDGILVSAAAPGIPHPLVEQLAEGGKLVLPVGDLSVQEMIQVTKRKDGSLQIAEGIGCRFVPLLGKHGFHLKA